MEFKALCIDLSDRMADNFDLNSCGTGEGRLYWKEVYFSSAMQRP